MYSCLVPKSEPNITNFQACSEHAYCLNENNLPICQCKEGYTGDGYICNLILKKCEAAYW